jgi:hypothetical protein
MLCMVNGCSAEADEVHTVHTPGGPSYPVCEQHSDLIDGGEDWLPVGEPGNDDGSGPSGILMGEDLPWRVLAVSAVRAGGNRPGTLLKLTMVRHGESRDFETLVPDDEGEILRGALKP